MLSKLKLVSNQFLYLLLKGEQSEWGCGGLPQDGLHGSLASHPCAIPFLHYNIICLFDR